MGGAASRGRLEKWVEESNWEDVLERWEGFLNFLALVGALLCFIVIIVPLFLFAIFR